MPYGQSAMKLVLSFLNLFDFRNLGQHQQSQNDANLGKPLWYQTVGKKLSKCSYNLLGHKIISFHFIGKK